MGEFGIGQPVPRTEDPRLLRGGGQYGDDFVVANQAHGYILRSPHAHAKINSMDTAAAKTAPCRPTRRKNIHCRDNRPIRLVRRA